MSPVFVSAVGLAAPGLPGWSAARDVLAGRSAYVHADAAPYQPQLLPPNERRRATPAVRQAFRAAEDAVAGRDPARLASVFAGSDGDMVIVHRIAEALAQPERVVSPTDFHNSVHNAAAGYWGIAVGSRAPSTTLAGYDGSFAAGLVEAAAQVGADGHDVLLVVFDVPAPEPLLAARPLGCAASCALVLSRDAQGSASAGAAQAGAKAIARLGVALSADRESVLDDPALEALRRGNPALRALPLLRLLARNEPGSVVLPGSGGRNLRVNVLTVA